MPKSLSATLAVFCASLVIFFASGHATRAASLSGVSLVIDGQCGLSGSSDTFSLNMTASGSEFPSVDETITFPDTSTQDQDVDIFYVTDAANVVIGRYAQGFVTNQAFVGGAFFTVNQRPTVSGNFTVRLVDELDRTPDLTLGATFSTSNTILGSTSFDATALDPDCVPVVTDTTPPQATSVTIQSNNSTTSVAKVGDTVTLQMTFDESLGTAPSVTLIGQTASVSGSGTSWSASATVTSSSPQGAATFSILGYKDDAGNTGTTVTSTTNGSSVTVDRTSPSTSLASTVSGPTNTTPVPLTVTFTEAVTGFTAADLAVAGGAVSNFAGSGSSYSFDLTPSGDGTVTVDVAAGVAQDAAGNGNTAATQFSIAYDQTAPSLTISGVPASFLPGETFTVRFGFGESVTGFDASDVSVSGATKGALSGGPQSFTMSITPDGTTNVTVSVADGAATDAAGNHSAAASATARIDSAAVASKQIAGFLHNRIRNLVQNQPKLTGFLRGGDGGHFNVEVTRGASDISVGTGNKGPFWFSMQGSNTTYDNRSGDTAFALAVVGGHAQVRPGLLVGGMIQFDHARDDQGGGIRTSGNGWLAGPYAVMQITDQPIYLEGRLLYGKSSNKISPFGTFADSFKTHRLLSMVALEGQYQAERFRYAPRLQLSYVSEHQKAYVDGLSNLVPDQTVRQTELSAGIDFEMPLVDNDNRHLFTWGLAGIWSQLEGKGAASSYINGTEGGRARIDLGYLYNGGDGLQASAKMFLDGIGSGGFTTRGVSIEMSLNF